MMQRFFMASLFWELFFVGGSTIVQAELIVGMSYCTQSWLYALVN